MRGGVNFNFAIGLHRDGHAFFKHIPTRPFQEGGNAAPAQLACLGRLRGACGETLPIGGDQCLVHDFLKTAAIIALAHGVLVGHLLWPDHVAPTKLRRIKPKLARRRIHQAFDDVNRLRPPGAAIRAGGGGIGQHSGELEINIRDVIDAGGNPRPDQQLNGDT